MVLNVRFLIENDIFKFFTTKIIIKYDILKNEKAGLCGPAFSILLITNKFLKLRKLF
jgi:hypothetical protein